MVKFGVVGFGYWGPNIVRNLTNIKGAQVQLICDIDRGALKRAREVYPHTDLFRDYRDAVNSKVIDAVAIATPPSTHFEIAKKALKNNKDVFVEKPLATTVRESEGLLKFARKNRRTLMVDHTFIYSGVVRKIKQLITSNALGDLYYYDSTRVSLGLFRRDVNVIWDLASHDFSIMDYLIQSKPVSLAAQGLNHVGGQVNTAYITVYFKDNLIGHISANWLSPVKIRTTLIGGQKKMLLWDDLQADEKLKLYDKGVEIKTKEGIHRLLVDYRTGDVKAPRLERTEPLRVGLEHFIDCAVNGKTPLSDGEAGLRVVKMLVAANESLRNKGRMVKI